MLFIKLSLAAFFALLVFSVTDSDSAEQRCNALGADCACSEPLNTNSAPKVSTSWYNPSDSTTKECKGETGVGAPITRNAEAPLFTADSQALAALPSGHTVTNVMRGADGHVGIFFINNGNQFSAPYPKRFAVRFYRYYSPNYEFAGEASCQNSKLTETIGPGHPHGDNGQGALGWYDFTGFTSPTVPDCCSKGPGNNFNFYKNYFRGKWTRHEIVVVNPAGGSPGNGLYFLHYVKDITNNGPEYVAVDSRIAGGAGVFGPSAWPSSQQSGFTPSSPIRGIAANNYRQGTCKGYSAWSHYMVASWSTDAGQRIGAASEIEGGAGAPPPPTSVPSAPSSLIVQ